MTRVLLIPHPHFRWKDDRLVLEPYLPLGLVSLATVLRRDGIDAELIDPSADAMGWDHERLTETILARKPDVIGFSTAWSQYPTTLKLAELCKAANPQVQIVLGGVHATIADRGTVAAFPFVDAVVRGESEGIIGRVVRALPDRRALSRIPGVTTLLDGTTVRTPDAILTPDLDELPPPDYDLYPSLNSLESIPIDVGRGCPCRCTFCATNDFWHRTSRFRSVESVVRTLKRLRDGHDCRKFAFLHDTLTISRDRVVDLCTAIRREKLDITWQCSTRTDCLDVELLDRMAEAGCVRILIGIETGSPRMQVLTKKGLNLTQVSRTCELIARSGISFHASFVVGFPGETMDNLVETIRLLSELRFAGRTDESISLELLRPILGSELYEQHRSSLRYDGYYSDIAVAASAKKDADLIARHPGVFAPFYYLDTPTLSREVAVKAAHLFRNLCRLPYSLYILSRAEGFDFPRLLLDHLSLMDIPQPSQVQFQDVSGIETVSLYVQTLLTQAGLGDHCVSDVLRYETAVGRLIAKADDHHEVVVQAFRFDVESLIEEISNSSHVELPGSLVVDQHSILFSREGSRVRTSRVPFRVAELLRE